MTLQLELPDEDATRALGAALAQVVGVPVLIGLSGDLGAGKTTLVRALINAQAPGTRVKSPTYTLVESYSLAKGVLHHLDLYRLQHPEELAALGIDDLLAGDAVVLVEWPAKGVPVLPRLDMTITLVHQKVGRFARLQAQTVRGREVLSRLSLPGAITVD